MSSCASCGEAAFRELEEDRPRSTRSATRAPSVVALGGGARAVPAVREALAGARSRCSSRSTPDEAWERVRGSGDRPLADDATGSAPASPSARRSTTRPPTRRAAGRRRRRARRGRRARRAGRARAARATSSPARAPVALVADARVAGIHGAAVQLALGAAPGREHELPAGEDGEAAPAHERAARRADASGATARWSRSAAAATTDVGRVRGGHVPARHRLGGRAHDARRPGGRGDRRQDRARPRRGKNLVGAFHWPVRAVLDPGAARHAARARAAERPGRGGQDRAARRRAALGAARARARAPLRRLQGRRLPARPARRRRARAAQPRPHVRARARGRRRTTAWRTATRSRSACSRRSALSGQDTAPVEETLAPAARARRRASGRGRALARDKKARDGRVRLVLSTRRAGRARAWRCPRPTSARALDALDRRA